MIRNLENTDRIAKTVSTVYLLQALKIPSALVEVGFRPIPKRRVYWRKKHINGK